MNDQAWKQKYLKSLDEHEAKEKQWQATEALLRQGLNRVALAAQGLDSQLDQDLSHLRNVIRGSIERPRLEAVIDDLSKSVTRLDASRSGKTHTVTAQEVLVKWLDSLGVPAEFKSPLKVIRRRIDDTTQITDLEAPLRELGTLLNGALNRSLARPEDKAGGEGFFSRLFAGKPEASPAPAITAAVTTSAPATFTSPATPVTTVTTVTTATSSAAPVGMPVGAPQHTPQHASQVTAIPKAVAPAAASTASVAKDHRLSEFCIQLLDTLSLPESLDEQTQELRDKLAHGFAEQAIGPALQAIAGLISSMRTQMQRENNELQDFLRQLTSHLQDIDQHLAGAKGHQLASRDSGRRLDAVVTAQVTEIESTVGATQDPDQLKQQIQIRLDAIRLHLDEYRQTEEHNQQALEARLAQLDDRVRNMEAEGTQLRQRLQEKHQLAMLDPLTGLNNRLAFDERLMQEFARSKRYQKPLVLAVIDIDHFKSINDRYGHKAGDKALMLIAGQLKQHLRETDFLARFGGEEFVVLMPETELAAAAVAAEKLRTAVVACQFHYQGTSVDITISTGLTRLDPQDSTESLFQRADQAMYQAKQGGRNRCVSIGT